MLPAVSQGAVGIECRADDKRALGLLAAIDHAATTRCVLAERALLLGLGGSCHSPIAALAREDGADIRLKAQILTEDGAEQVTGEALLPGGDRRGATALAQILLEQASPALRALFGNL